MLNGCLAFPGSNHLHLILPDGIEAIPPLALRSLLLTGAIPKPYHPFNRMATPIPGLPALSREHQKPLRQFKPRWFSTPGRRVAFRTGT